RINGKDIPGSTRGHGDTRATGHSGDAQHDGATCEGVTSRAKGDRIEYGVGGKVVVRCLASTGGNGREHQLFDLRWVAGRVDAADPVPIGRPLVVNPRP